MHPSSPPFHSTPPSQAASFSHRSLEIFSISQSFYEISYANAFWQDVITGDEIISDSYNLKEIDGIAYEADCKKITIGNDNIGPSSLDYLHSCNLWHNHI